MLIFHAYSPWWVELLLSLCKWEAEKQNTKGHFLKWCLWDLNLTVYLHSLWPFPAVQTHNHGSICTIELVTLYLWNLKKKTDLNNLKKKIYFDLWFLCTDNWLLKYGCVVRPSITVVGMCGKGQGTLLMGCQKAKRERQRKETGNHINLLNTYLQWLTSSGLPPPFTFPPTPIFHQIINLLVDSSINEGRDLTVQTLPKVSALVTSPSTQEPSTSFYIQTTRTMLHSNYDPEIRTHMYTM